jgi:hypothetical protein
MMEMPAMSDDYARGRRDGLRLALSILAAEEAKWEALLGESPSWRTNATRAIRHKAYQVATKRVQTALNRLLPKAETALPAEIASMIDQAGYRGIVSAAVGVERGLLRLGGATRRGFELGQAQGRA